MDIQSLDKKLTKIQEELHKETELLKNSLKQYSDYEFTDSRDEYLIKEHYYSMIDIPEAEYQKANHKYKKLISNYSQAYLDICDFYVGPELPRQTLLDSKEDINLLYFMFVMSFFIT